MKINKFLSRRKLFYVMNMFFLLYALAVFVFSLYKVASFYQLLRPIKIFALDWSSPPDPPDPPNPPCPPCCHTPTPVPPTPTLIPPTPTPESPTPSPTLPSEPTPTWTISPTATPLLPTPTPKVEEGGGVGGPPGGESPGPASPPVCTDAVPPKPYLRDLKILGGGKVSLFWDPVEPATHYNISYGPESGNYLYGVDNTGKTTSFTVSELGSANYCFAIKAVNNCMPGELSNERCTQGQVLGAQKKILGASVLAATGGFNENLSNFMFLVGCLCSSIGVRIYFGGKKSV